MASPGSGGHTSPPKENACGRPPASVDDVKWPPACGRSVVALMRRKPWLHQFRWSQGEDLYDRAPQRRAAFRTSTLDLARPRRRLGDVSDHLAYILLLRFECYVGLRDDADESIVFVDDR